MEPADNTENAGNVDEFKHFEIVSLEAKDHHYLNPTHNDTKGHDAANATNANTFQTVVMKEWKILEENLPDAIYVRAYETRTDLLRAVIIGAPGTPYNDGLFFFDIFLPPNYPNTPPTVHYHSHGHRLNPNLYDCGYVCLSLLNTWRGSEKEMWTKDSTILQLLVSIQGLVLNERPYFNEPGYADYFESKDARWINEYIKYSEKAFIRSCKTLLKIVKKPPEGFEGFVVRHFKGRVEAMLATIDGYMEGGVVAGVKDFPSEMDTTSFKADLVKIKEMMSNALVMLDKPNSDSACLKEGEGVELEAQVEEEEEEEEGDGEVDDFV